MENRNPISIFIAGHAHDIMSTWEAECKRRMPASRDQDSLILRNHLPLILDDIRQALDSALQPGCARRAGAQAFVAQHSQIHGRQRATISGYSAEQVIHEYFLLKNVINDFITDANLWQRESMEAINEVIDLNIMKSVTEFHKAIEKIREQVLGTLAHDIRNPLSVAATALYVTNEDENVSDTNARMNRLALQSVQRALDMLSGLLDTIAIEAGDGISMNFEQADFAKCVRKAATEAQQTYRQVTFNIPDNDVAGVFDPAAIRRIIENLTSNAIRYGDVDKDVQVTLQDEGDMVQLSVHNEGKPIAQDKQGDIFKFVSSAYNHTERDGNSWSMGLTFVKMATEAHQGELSLVSNETEGTTFTIRLPKFANEPGKFRMSLTWREDEIEQDHSR